MTRDDIDERRGPAAPGAASEGPLSSFSYFPSDLDPADVGALFDACAALYLAPWHLVRGRPTGFAFTIRALGVEDWCAAFTTGDDFLGLAIFDERPDDERRAALFAAMDAPSVTPPHNVMVSFEPEHGVSKQLVAEIAEHGWKLAKPDAIPVVHRLVTGGELARPSTREVHVLEAFARAVARAIQDDRATFLATLDRAGTWTKRDVVPTRAGEVEVQLELLAPETPEEDIGLDDPSPDYETLRAFLGSPEARTLSAAGHLPFLEHLSTLHLGEHLADLDEEGLDELLFDLVPRKLDLAPLAARSLVDELGAFYAFLARTRGAPDLLARLPDVPDASELVHALEHPLGGPHTYRDTEPRVTASFPADEATTTAASTARQPRPTAPSQAAKTKRKAARKARKKNR